LPFSSRLRSSRHSQIMKRLLPQLQIYHRRMQATPDSIIRPCIYLTLRARLDCNESFTRESRETTSTACCCRCPTTFIRQGPATRILEATTTTAPLPPLLAPISERVGPHSYLIYSQCCSSPGHHRRLHRYAASCHQRKRSIPKTSTMVFVSPRDWLHLLLCSRVGCFAEAALNLILTF
jgi:hypothetical protein